MKPTTTLAALLLCGLSLLPFAAPARADEAAIRQELDALKQGQEAIRKDLDEIKKLLQARPTQPQRGASVEALTGAVAIGDNPPKGKSAAKLTLVEFSDYQCPFCKRYVDQTLPGLMKDYVEAGSVRYVFRDLPLESIHPQAFKAAEAARCAGEQGKFWEMHDLLFANQAALQAEKLPEYAKQLGLKPAAFEACLSSDKYADAIRRDVADAQALGIRGTPGFVLGVSDGDSVKDAVLIRGAQPLASFKAEIDKRLSPPTAATP
jgi:protein-disulfide isomerase